MPQISIAFAIFGLKFLFFEKLLRLKWSDHVFLP